MAKQFEYVRRVYKVPAKRGMRVKVAGMLGKITSDGGYYINVLFDGHKHPQPCHPTWEIFYCVEASNV